MKWPTVELGEVVEFQAGIGFPPALQGRTTGDLPFAKVGDISRHGRIGSKYIESADNYVSKAELVTLRAKPVIPGSTVFAKIGEAIRQNHRAIAACEILIDNNAMAATPKRFLDANYLYRFLQSVDLYQHATATTVPSLRKTVLQGIPMPFPPLDEQRRIAAILDSVDSLRTKQRQVITTQDVLTKSIFTELFSEGASGRRWPTVRLGDVVLTIDSGSSPVCETRTASEGEWGVLKLGAISYGVFKSEENKAFLGDLASIRKVEVGPGDLLFSRKNTKELVGATAVAYAPPPQLLLPDLIFRLNIDRDRVEAEYLHELLRSPRKRPAVMALASGSASSMSNISKARLIELPIELPPIDLQRVYSERVRNVNGLRHHSHRVAAQLDGLFASLQSRAFSGQR